jgi:hypothetical protein
VVVVVVLVVVMLLLVVVVVRVHCLESLVVEGENECAGPERGYMEYGILAGLEGCARENSYRSMHCSMVWKSKRAFGCQ